MANNGSTTPNRAHQGLSPDPADASDFNDTMSTSMETYSFPHRKLSQKLVDSSKTPLVLVACGSFSPPTYLHLRMFEIAADYVRENTNFEIVGGYMSPVNSNYKKEGLESADVRVKMCMLATMGHDWLSVDDWEGLAPSYVPTAQVLDHFDAELKGLGGVATEDGKKKPVRVALLAGADLISTFGTPGVWSPQDLEHILGEPTRNTLARFVAYRNSGRYGCFILERMGVDIDESLENLDRWISNIWFINQPITNDVSIFPI